MFKRIFLFVLTNILVMVTVSIVLSVLGVNHYVTAQGLNYSSLMIFCLVWGFVGSGISLMLSKFDIVHKLVHAPTRFPQKSA